MRIPAIVFYIVSASGLSSGSAAEDAGAAVVAPAGALKEGITFAAHDTLKCTADDSTDAAQCLKELTWDCAPFHVRCEPARGHGDWLMRFPTPFPGNDPINDVVALEWYMARDEAGQPVRAPAIVIVHESGRAMAAGRVFARGLREKRLNVFVVHLPGYGERASENTKDIRRMLPALKQAVADVRRARDAVAVLPFIDSSLIAVQGISLGGFVAATVAGLDRGYQRAFILLAGGNIADVLLTGNRDAAIVRRILRSAGITEDEIKSASQVIEPMRLAHRVDAAATWLFSGEFDEVVPPRCSHAFAKAAGLPPKHHVEYPVGHYSAALLMPFMLQHIAELMNAGEAGSGKEKGDGLQERTEETEKQ